MEVDKESHVLLDDSDLWEGTWSPKEEREEKRTNVSSGGITSVLDRVGINKPAKSLRRKAGSRRNVALQVKGEEIPQEDRDEDCSGSPVVRHMGITVDLGSICLGN